MKEVIYVIMEKDGKQYFESMNETHIFWATSFRDAMFFENKLKAIKYNNDKQIGGEVCRIIIEPQAVL